MKKMKEKYTKDEIRLLINKMNEAIAKMEEGKFITRKELGI